MKKKHRFVSVLCLAALLGGCASPYRAQMDALHHAYLAGNVSPREYRREMTRLEMADAAWQQNNANAAVTAAAIGAAAVGVAAAVDHHDHHHHYDHGHHHH